MTGEWNKKGLWKIIEENRQALLSATRASADACAAAAVLRDAAVVAYRDAGEDADLRQAAGQVQGMCERIRDAVAEIPDELWAMMLMVDSATPGLLRADLEARLGAPVQGGKR